jgi:hypothetical protein
VISIICFLAIAPIRIRAAKKERHAYVRFGSLADIARRLTHVRFASESGHKRETPQSAKRQ